MADATATTLWFLSHRAATRYIEMREQVWLSSQATYTLAMMV
jgi:hypothetical protein